MTTTNPITIQNLASNEHDLSLEEEIQLITLAKTNINYKTFVFDYFTKRVITPIAKHYVRGDVVSIKDLTQQGYLGLDRAIQDYNPDRCKRFSTYARWWVTAFIVSFYRDNSRSFPISGSISSKLHALVVVNEALEQKLGRIPTIPEIAEASGYEEGHIVYLQRFLHTGTPIHELHENQEGEEGGSMENVLPDNHSDSPMDRTLRLDGIQNVKEALSILNETERFILVKRYGLDGDSILTLSEVGAKMVELPQGKKKTAERVRQIQMGAEEKLRKVLNK